MEFEYNKQKSLLNEKKHGISLPEATGLWSVVNVQLEAYTRGETRWMIVGKLGEKLYSCVFTMRGDLIRLISARRSHLKEERVYHERIGQKENQR